MKRKVVDAIGFAYVVLSYFDTLSKERTFNMLSIVFVLTALKSFILNSFLVMLAF